MSAVAKELPKYQQVFDKVWNAAAQYKANRGHPPKPLKPFIDGLGIKYQDWQNALYQTKVKSPETVELFKKMMQDPQEDEKLATIKKIAGMIHHNKPPQDDDPDDLIDDPPGDSEEVIEEPEDEEEDTEPYAESDALRDIIAALEAIPETSRARVMTSAAVFHNIGINTKALIQEF